MYRIVTTTSKLSWQYKLERAKGNKRKGNKDRITNCIAEVIFS